MDFGNSQLAPAQLTPVNQSIGGYTAADSNGNTNNNNSSTPIKAFETPRITTCRGGVGSNGFYGRECYPTDASAAVESTTAESGASPSPLGGGHRTRGRRGRLVVNDRVYGQILFPPVMQLFIDTPEVQRLRDLKQLGNTHYVYPSATHTRFEHSLGVSHLAMRFLEQILKNHRDEPDLGIDLPPANTPEMDRNIWCVGIAGLCHDLGHGPLSHLFERHVNSVREKEEREEWNHEQASITLVRRIWEARRDELRTFGLGDEDMRFVELLINGLKPGKEWPADVGRDRQMRFLTDIIANKRSGLDVDKLDYLQRDSLSCFGTQERIACDRIFQGAFVMEDDRGETQICYQQKLAWDLDFVFQVRSSLHRIVYQHRVTCVADQMMKDALCAANEHFRISYKDEHYRLSDCVDIPSVFVEISDWIVNAILFHRSAELRPAKHILERIQSRQFYMTIGTSSGHDLKRLFNEGELIATVRCEALRAKLRGWASQHPDLPVVDVVETKFTRAASDMGKKKDPLDAILFFNPRMGSDARPFLRSAPLECGLSQVHEGRRDGPVASQTAPLPVAELEQTLIVFCRMPLTPQEHTDLCEAFGEVARRKGAPKAVGRASMSQSRRSLSLQRPDASWDPHRRSADRHRLAHGPVSTSTPEPHRFPSQHRAVDDHDDTEEGSRLLVPEPDVRKRPRVPGSLSDELFPAASRQRKASAESSCGGARSVHFKGGAPCENDAAADTPLFNPSQMEVGEVDQEGEPEATEPNAKPTVW